MRKGTKLPLTAFPHGCVRVTDGYSVNAFAKETDYLLSLEEGRLLAGFYRNAGLLTPYSRYGGWENSLIGGHTFGHVLTALAQGSTHANADGRKRAEMRQKLIKIVDGLLECQKSSRGDVGFLWGAVGTDRKNVEAQFDNVEQGKTDIGREAWVPWYTMHKLIAGLVDCYRLTRYERAKEVAAALGDWVFRRVSRWDERMAQRVLSVEYGGMNDCMYALYAVTGNEAHAVAAHKFDEEALFDRILSDEKDVLKDLHANTTIPKVLGALSRYFMLQTKGQGKKAEAMRYLQVAERFFRNVVGRHTYVTGGNSEWEHFGPDYLLDAERTNCNCETCNVYNMLKLARGLFCATGSKFYTDYYENAYLNTVLSSQNPETGMTTYFQSMASGFFKVYGDPYDKFWCCTGSGMESFTKLGDSAYYTDGKNLFVEQYIASRLTAEEVTLDQKADFPLNQTAEFTVQRAKTPFLLYFRIPDWATLGMRIWKNGTEAEGKAENGHLCVRAQEGDVFRVEIPCTVILQGLADCDHVYAFRYGNAVLSADLGTEALETEQTGVSVTIPKRKICATERICFPDLADMLKHPANYLVKEGERFHLRGGDLPLTFGLHYKRYRERYAIYWYLCEENAKEESSDRK